MHLLKLEQIEPLLARPLSEAEKPRISGWLVAIEAFLITRYSIARVAELAEYFVVFAADAVQRRLDKKNQLADSESVGPFSVRWNSASAQGGWFLPGELADMDGTLGVGGIRTYRTQAPAEVVTGNLSRRNPVGAADDSLGDHAGYL